MSKQLRNRKTWLMVTRISLSQCCALFISRIAAGKLSQRSVLRDKRINGSTPSKLLHCLLTRAMPYLPWLGSTAVLSTFEHGWPITF